MLMLPFLFSQRLNLASLVFQRGDSDACEANQAGPRETYDPLSWADDPDAFAELKVNETKIGHLAMFFLSCYYMQAIVISEGGVENSNIADRYSTSGLCLSLLGTLWLCSLPVVVCLTTRLHGTAPETQHVVGEHPLEMLVPRE